MTNLICHTGKILHYHLEKQLRQGTTSTPEGHCHSIFCIPNVTVGTAVTQLRNLKAMGLIGTWSGRGQVTALNCQRESPSICGRPVKELRPNWPSLRAQRRKTTHRVMVYCKI